MESEEQTNLGPVRVKPEGSNISGGNWKTRLYEERGERHVLKVDQRISRELTRKNGELKNEYYQRRLKACFDFISHEVKDDRTVRAFVPLEVKAPEEFHFIIDGDDGFPVAARLQEKVEGKMLKDVEESTLSEENRKALHSLLDASIRCYLSTGRVLDLTGWCGKDEGRFKWLILSMTKPLGGSSNIFVNAEGNLVMIDLKPSFPGDSIARKIGRFVHFAGLLSYKVIEEIKRLIDTNPENNQNR